MITKKNWCIFLTYYTLYDLFTQSFSLTIRSSFIFLFLCFLLFSEWRNLPRFIEALCKVKILHTFDFSHQKSIHQLNITSMLHHFSSFICLFLFCFPKYLFTQNSKDKRLISWITVIQLSFTIALFHFLFNG